MVFFFIFLQKNIKNNPFFPTTIPFSQTIHPSPFTITIMFFRRNNLNIGIGLGMLVPIIFFGLISSIVSISGLLIKTRTLALIAICLNMLLVSMFRKNRANESIRGIVLATVALAFVWFAWFYKEILAEW
jgi:hypothetical protein